MPKAGNAEVYGNFVKDVNSRCQERGKTFTSNKKQVQKTYEFLQVCTHDSCQPDQGIEPGSYSTNLSDQTGLMDDDISSTASPSPSTSSDGSNSLDFSTPKPGKMFQ